MAVTIEDIQNFIKEKGDKPDGFVIRTSDEDATYLENFKAAEIEKALEPKVNEAYSNIDTVLSGVTGIKKIPNEKTSIYAKRILEDLKAKADKHPELEQEIASLREKVGKNADAKLLADLENVRAEFAAFKTAKETELEKLRKDTDLNERKAVIEAEVNSFVFDPSIKDNVLKVYKQTIINELLQNSEKRDGQLVFLDDKGNPLRNQAKNLATYTANEIVAERMKDVIKQKRTIPGPPSPGDPTQPPKSLPDTVKTKVELSDHLLKEGLKRGTKEYDEAYAQLSVDLPAGY
jgi:hypothetical protein